MMASHSRVFSRYSVVLFIVVLLLGGCAQGQGVLGTTPTTVDTPEVTRTMHFVDGFTEGPDYDVALTLPDEWAGNIVTRDSDNVIYFEYVTATGTKPVFSIEALSEKQYWMQNGSYPGQQINLQNTPSTYFVYHLITDTTQGGLSRAEFSALAEQVPQVMSSFEIIQ